MPLPVGLVYDAAGSVAFDPDRQVQSAIKMVFDTFRETGSASATAWGGATGPSFWQSGRWSGRSATTGSSARWPGWDGPLPRS